MGNNNSIPQNSKSNNSSNDLVQQEIQKLQQQVLRNQIIMQQMQMKNMNQPNLSRQRPNNQNNPNNQNYQMNSNLSQVNLNSILNNPSLRVKLRADPILKRQLLSYIINEYKDHLTDYQKKQIKDFFKSLNQSSNQPPNQSSNQPFNQSTWSPSSYHNQFQSQNHIEGQNQGQNQNSQFLHINQGTQDLYSKQRQLMEQQNDIQTISKNYRDDENRAKREFELQEKRRRQQFEQEQRQRKMEFQTKLKHFENEKIDALRLFQLPPNYNIEQLKQAYKKLALRTHPDRPSGSKQKFQVVTKCYFLLVEKYKKKQQDKQFLDLRSASQKYFDTQKNNSKQNVQLSKDKFDVRVFNKLYEEHRLDDPNDAGYEKWLRSEENSGYEQPKIFSDKFNINVFNSLFDNHKQKYSSRDEQQVVKYQEPQALVISKNMNYTEIDVQNQRGNSFTRNIGNKNNIDYTDLKQAYTKTNLVDPRKVKTKQYRNIHELEEERGNLSYEMDEAQLAALHQRKIQEEIEEQHRTERIKQRDNQIFDSYSAIHKKMLGYGPK